MPTPSRRTSLHLLLALLAFIMMAIHPRHATCQQDSPFEGQGLDPFEAGFFGDIDVPKDRLPVYLSVILQKLVDVDGEQLACALRLAVGSLPLMQ